MDLNEYDQAVHLSEYFHVLRRHKWTIIVSLVIIASLILLYNSRLEPIYRATATLIIDKEMVKSPLTGERLDYETYLSESLTFNTHFKLITSRSVMEQVIKTLKVDQEAMAQKKEEFAQIGLFKQWLSQLKKNILLLTGRDKEISHPEDKITGLVEVLQTMVNVKHIEETRLLKLSVASHSPNMAMNVANALAQVYIDFNRNNRLLSSQNTLSWLTDRLYGMKKKLEDAEEEFLAFKQRVKLISVEDNHKIIAQKITDFNDAYIKTRNRRLELDAKLKQLKRISKSGEKTPHLRSLIENPLINDLHGKLVNAEVELSRISKVYKHKHPKTIQVNTQIDNIRKKLDQEIEKELNNQMAERAVLLSKEKVLQKTTADFEKEAMETNKKELQYTILKRNVEINQNLYDTLLSRLKEADITGNIDVSNIRITEKAILPSVPVGPNKKRNLALGIVFGLMIGIGLSFLSEYLDRSIRTEEDIQRYLGLPVLSIIPLADQAGGRQSGENAKGKTKRFGRSDNLRLTAEGETISDHFDIK
jgi:uncharacterized protein involved in exopolysaccharide biosynthesis